MSADNLLDKNTDQFEDIQDAISEAKEDMTKRKMKKNQIAKEITKQAQKRITSAKSELRDYQNDVNSALENLTAKKQALFENTLKNSQQILAGLGIEKSAMTSLPETQIDITNPTEKQLEAKEITGGIGSGLFWALLAGLATLAGWCYAATKSLGLPLLPEKFPDIERLNKSLEWTSETIGLEKNNMYGGIAVALLSLLVMWIVYKLIVGRRASKNLRNAQIIEQKAETYASEHDANKHNLLKMQQHIGHNSQTINDFDVLLQEQNAKLKRALYFEKKENYAELHSKTKNEVKVTKHLMTAVEKLLEAPISSEGKLDPQSVKTLKSAHLIAKNMISKLYH